MRPYSDIRAHDRDIVDQWNAVVGDEHNVWHLGDFAGEQVPLERAAEIFRKLNGQIRLIRGNHDGDEVCSKLPWASVDIRRTIVGSDGRKVVLCQLSAAGMGRVPRRRSPGVRPADLRRHRRADEGGAGRGIAASSTSRVVRRPSSGHLGASRIRLELATRQQEDDLREVGRRVADGC